MIKKCAICDKEFEAKRITAMYCSQRCKDRAKVIKAKAANPFKVCPGCGETFPNVDKRRFCSDKCRQRTRRKNTHAKCLECEKLFTSKGGARYCSKDCRSRAIHRLNQKRYKDEIKIDPYFLRRGITTATRGKYSTFEAGNEI